MEQDADDEPDGGDARLVFVTHPALERDVQACLHELRQLDVVESIGASSGWSASDRGVEGRHRGVPQLPAVNAATPVVTLLEGGTPLLEAPRLSERVGPGCCSKSRA